MEKLLLKGKRLATKPAATLINDQRRWLLTPSSSQADANKPKIDVHEARDVLRNIVGSSKIWGEERDPSITNIVLPTSQDVMPKKRMLDSYREAVIPLKSKPMFRSIYLNFYNGVRIGKILESLDTMAVWIGYTHNADPTQAEFKSPLSIVTAFVDNISLQPNSINSDCDILLKGHVTWVGNTSMEITMQVEQESPDGSWQEVLEAHFMMVARDPRNKGKAMVYPLALEGPEEQALFQKGEEHKQQLLQQSRESLLKTPPTEDERLLIHDLFLNSLEPKASTFRRPVKPEGSVWMDDTKLKNLIICFPEQRNLYNKMFGGFLMRAAYELGWTNATVYSKSRVMVTAMDDIMFRKPVEIGSLLYLSSQVVYTEGLQLQVRVHAQVVDPKTGVQDTTNVFHFTFQTNTHTDVPTVTPNSYSEYMMYLDGKRHFKSSKSKTTP